MRACVRVCVRACVRACVRRGGARAEAAAASSPADPPCPPFHSLSSCPPTALHCSDETVLGSHIVEMLETTPLAAATEASGSGYVSGGDGTSSAAAGSGGGSGDEWEVFPVEQPTTARARFGGGSGGGGGRSGVVDFARTVVLTRVTATLEADGAGSNGARGGGHAAGGRAAAEEALAGMAADAELRAVAEVVMGRLEDFDLLPGSVAASKAQRVRQQLLDPATRRRLESVAAYATGGDGGGTPFPEPPPVPQAPPPGTSLDGWSPERTRAISV